MELGNIKFHEPTHICRFPPEQNLNIISLTFLSGRLGFVKRNKFWIGFSAILIFLGFAFIQYRLSFGPMEPPTTASNVDIGNLVVIIVGVLIMMILAARCFGRSAPSGRTRITRSSSDSVDGFGGARALDFSHSQSGYGSKGGLPVSLSKERQRTATFREGATDRIEDEKKRSTE